MEREVREVELGWWASSAWTVAKPNLYEGWRRRSDKKKFEPTVFAPIAKSDIKKGIYKKAIETMEADVLKNRPRSLRKKAGRDCRYLTTNLTPCQYPIVNLGIPFGLVLVLYLTRRGLKKR